MMDRQQSAVPHPDVKEVRQELLEAYKKGGKLPTKEGRNHYIKSIMVSKTPTLGVLSVFLVMAVLLLLCVPLAEGLRKDYPPTTWAPDPTPPMTPGTPPTPRPHCWNPEECCIHPFDSEKFDECCVEHGCCPVSCPTTMPGTGITVPTRGCRAWECCVHREASLEHQLCCQRHGCCPVCERVSSGCCYNGIRYAFRTVVEDLHEVCVQLVCAAKLMPNPPYFVAQITAVRTCFFEMSEECLGCPVYQCVDEFGLVRMEGEMWSPTPCVKCECREGQILCIGFLEGCPPPPQENCIRIPGPCCPTYHCEDGCVDEDGVFRPVGAHWPSTIDPCGFLTCVRAGTQAIIQSANIACLPPPPPHEGCFLQDVQDQCCPEWNCSRCLDSDGTFHPLHDEWQSGPCIVKICTTNGIVIRDVFCPTLGPAPHHTCFRDVMTGSCCEQWKCNGCWDGDILHPTGSQWPSEDPCVTNECTDDGIVPRPSICPDFPKPHESCFEFIPDGSCCPIWNCSGCLDDHGAYHPLYHEWQIDQCTTLVCHLNGITTKLFPCPTLPPAPHFTCHEVFTADGCCKEWKCEGCFDDDGDFHLVGSEWTSSNPCELMKCLPSGVIDIQIIFCDYPVPPHKGCIFQRIEGTCCGGDWNCSGCLDDGKFRKLYEEWKSDPCTTHVCTHSGIQTTHLSCQTLPRPHYLCKLEHLPGQCCPSWNCKYERRSNSCYDENQGFEYESGAEWSAADPCVVHRCDSGDIVTLPLQCEPEPASSDCTMETREGECCPTWNCSSLDCSAVQCEGPPWNADCEANMVSGQCCPSYKCLPAYVPNKPGCKEHCRGPPLNEYCNANILLDDCCPQYSCSPPVLPPAKPECAAVICFALPMISNCTVTTPPGECCPKYDCDTTGPSPTSGPPPAAVGFDCKDESGIERKNGDVWISSEDVCTKSQCHNGLIIHHYQC